MHLNALYIGLPALVHVTSNLFPPPLLEILQHLIETRYCSHLL